MGESIVSRNINDSNTNSPTIKSNMDPGLANGGIAPNSMSATLMNSLNNNASVNSNVNPLNLNARQPLRQDGGNIANYNYQYYPNSFSNNFQPTYPNYTYPNYNQSGQQSQSQVAGHNQISSQQMIPQQQGTQVSANHASNQVPSLSQAQLPPQPPSTEIRPRGDSIYLPPPGSSQFKLFGDEVPPISRSNSIFNEKKKSNPENLITIQDFENYINSFNFGNSISNQGGVQGNVQNNGSMSGTTNNGSKDSLSNLLSFPFSSSRSNSQDRKNSKSSKNSSVDLSIWDNLPQYQSQLFQQNGSLSNILQGLTNSIDFTNMSNEQRRDSILKILNDSNFRQSLSMNLKEDIFKNNRADEKPTLLNPGISEVPSDAVSPSSLSSKSGAKYDAPPSPKTSPSQPSRNLPIEMSQNQHMNQQMPNQVNGYYNNQYLQPNYNYYSQNPMNNMTSVMGNMINPQSMPVTMSNEAPQQPHVVSNAVKSPKAKYSTALPKTLPVIEKTEKPKLGATKIDQLMLVIQARDKENKNNDIKIHTNQDGSIVGEIEPQHLIGGVEKNKLIPSGTKRELEDGEISHDDGKKHRKKLPQCPYCGKFFAQTTQLEVHIRSHIGLKPFECSYCHKRFTQGGNLTTHLRLHTGEKPFSCDICKKSFSRKGNLAAHRLTHDKLKPFECRLDGCDKLFTQLGNLKSHQNKFHLNTLNHLTGKLAELSPSQLDNLPQEEKELLNYFKNLYKNSNKGIKGRGKRSDNVNYEGGSNDPNK